MARVRSALLSTALAAAILAAPASAGARVTVTVEFAYGTVVVGGVGIFIYVAGSWETFLAGHDLPTSLLELRDGRLRPGVPLPVPDALPGEDGLPGERGGVRLDLLRWHF